MRWLPNPQPKAALKSYQFYGLVKNQSSLQWLSAPAAHKSMHRPTNFSSSPSSQGFGNKCIRMEENKTQIEKPRILCLHGFRTSAAILKSQVGRWPETVIGKLDLNFVDGPFPAQGKSDVEGIFDPPYFEWFRSSQGFREYYNFDECLVFLEDYMIKHGPFDGLLGFSQGAILSAALPGMQLDGKALTKVPKIKFVIIISGAKFGGSKFGLPKPAANAFLSPIKCPSLHIIGEMDFLKEQGTALLESFEDPVVIHHPKGHTVPKLDEKRMEIMLNFIEKIQKMPLNEGVEDLF